MRRWQRYVIPTLALTFIALVGHRIWRSARLENLHGPEMPALQLGEQEEQALYFSPAGSYTADDIAANGTRTPREKYRSFRARHDIRPRPGDRLCPITRTKAHPDCTWTIAGVQYEFCCPPCIDELVRWAKENPAALPDPPDLVQPATSARGAN